MKLKVALGVENARLFRCKQINRVEAKVEVRRGVVFAC
jgi:hypothetical protein